MLAQLQLWSLKELSFVDMTLYDIFLLADNVKDIFVENKLYKWMNWKVATV